MQGKDHEIDIRMLTGLDDLDVRSAGYHQEGQAVLLGVLGRVARGLADVERPRVEVQRLAECLRGGQDESAAGVLSTTARTVFIAAASRRGSGSTAALRG